MQYNYNSHPEYQRMNAELQHIKIKYNKALKQLSSVIRANRLIRQQLDQRIHHQHQNIQKNAQENQLKLQNMYHQVLRDNKTLNKQNQELKEQINKMERKLNEEIKRQSKDSTTQKNTNIAAINETNAKLQKENHQLKEKMYQLQEIINKNKIQNEKIQKQKQKIISELQQNNRRLLHEALQREVKQNEIRQKQQNDSTFVSTVKQMYKQITTMRYELTQLRSKYTDVYLNNSMLQTQKQMKQHKHREQLNEIEKQNANLKKEIKNANELLREEKKTNEELKSKIMELKEEKQIIEGKVIVLESMNIVSNYNQDHHSISNRIREFERRIQVLLTQRGEDKIKLDNRLEVDQIKQMTELKVYIEELAQYCGKSREQNVRIEQKYKYYKNKAIIYKTEIKNIQHQHNNIIQYYKNIISKYEQLFISIVNQYEKCIYEQQELNPQKLYEPISYLYENEILKLHQKINEKQIIKQEFSIFQKQKNKYLQQTLTKENQRLKSLQLIVNQNINQIHQEYTKKHNNNQKHIQQLQNQLCEKTLQYQRQIQQTKTQSQQLNKQLKQMAILLQQSQQNKQQNITFYNEIKDKLDTFELLLKQQNNIKIIQKSNPINQYLKSDNQSLRIQIDRYRKRILQLTQLLQDKQNQNQNTKINIKQNTQNQIRKYLYQIKFLQSQNLQLNQQIKNNNLKIGQYQSKNKYLDTQNNRLRAQIQQTQKLRIENNQLKAQLSKSQIGNSEQLYTKIAELSKSIIQIKKEFSELELSKNSAERKLKEMETLMQLKDKEQELRKNTNDVQTIHQNCNERIVALQNELKLKNNQINSWKKEIEALEQIVQSYKRTEGNYKGEITNKQEILQQLYTTRTNLTKVIQDRNNTIHNMELELREIQFRRERQRLQLKKEYQQKLIRIDSELQQSLNQNKLYRMEIGTLENNLNSERQMKLYYQNISNQQQQSSIQKLKDNVRHLQSINDSLNEQLQQQNRKHQRTVSRVRQQLEYKQLQLKQTKNHISSLKQQHHELKQKYYEFQSQNYDITINALRKTIQELGQDNTTKQNQIRNLQSQLNKLQKELVNNLNENHITILGFKEQYNELNQSHQIEINALKNLIEDKDNIIRLLNQQKLTHVCYPYQPHPYSQQNSSKSNNDDDIEEINKLNKQIISLRTTIISTKNQLQAKENIINELKQNIYLLNLKGNLKDKVHTQTQTYFQLTSNKQNTQLPLQDRETHQTGLHQTQAELIAKYDDERKKAMRHAGIQVGLSLQSGGAQKQLRNVGIQVWRQKQSEQIEAQSGANSPIGVLKNLTMGQDGPIGNTEDMRALKQENRRMKLRLQECLRRINELQNRQIESYNISPNHNQCRLIQSQLQQQIEVYRSRINRLQQQHERIGMDEEYKPIKYQQIQIQVQKYKGVIETLQTELNIYRDKYTIQNIKQKEKEQLLTLLVIAFVEIQSLRERVLSTEKNIKNLRKQLVQSQKDINLSNQEQIVDFTIVEQIEKQYQNVVHVEESMFKKIKTIKDLKMRENYHEKTFTDTNLKDKDQLDNRIQPPIQRTQRFHSAQSMHSAHTQSPQPFQPPLIHHPQQPRLNQPQNSGPNKPRLIQKPQIIQQYPNHPQMQGQYQSTQQHSHSPNKGFSGYYQNPMHQSNTNSYSSIKPQISQPSINFPGKIGNQGYHFEANK